jgi:isoamylase
MSHPFTVSAGAPWPLGATVTADGVNFAVFSAHATRMTLCLFEESGRETRVDLPEREGDVWHGHLAGIRPGQLYGYRAHGPYRPDEGHRFNPYKLLLDPYARRITGQPDWHDVLYGYTRGSASKDLAFDSRNSAGAMPRCVVEETAFPVVTGRPRTPLTDTVIYEAHVKGLTQLHPEVRAKGTFSGLAEPPILDHLTRLGVTAIELLPVQAFLDDRFLVDKGLVNYWGYQSVGFFAPEARYMPDGRIADFRHMVDRFHGAGIEVILDVVYNHSGEGDELGPTLVFRGLDNRSYYRLQHNPRYYVNDTGTGNTLNLEHPMVLRMVMDSLRYWVEVMGVDGFRFDLCATLGRTAIGLPPRRGLLPGDPAGPGAVARQAHRRTLGHRPGRLPARRLPRALPRMERPLPRRRAAVLARRSGPGARPRRTHHRLGPAVRPCRAPRHLLGQHAHRA